MGSVLCRAPPLPFQPVPGPDHQPHEAKSTAVPYILAVSHGPRRHEKPKAIQVSLSFLILRPLYLLLHRVTNLLGSGTSRGGTPGSARSSMRRAAATPTAARVGRQHRVQSAAEAVVYVHSVPCRSVSFRERSRGDGDVVLCVNTRCSMIHATRNARTHASARSDRKKRQGDGCRRQRDRRRQR